MDTPHEPSLIGRRLLARNVVWNLTGQILPLLVGLIAIPLLLSQLGADRFGILALVWIVIGYFSVFDLGLGRAMTQLVAERLGSGARNTVPEIVQATLLITTGLGVLGAAGLAGVAPWLVTRVLNIPPALVDESLHAFYLLAFSVPLVICSVCLRGVLEAHQRFDQVNAVRIPLGVFTFVGPLGALLMSHSLVPIVGVLLLGRVIACAAYAWLAARLTGRVGRWRRPDPAVAYAAVLGTALLVGAAWAGVA